MDGLPANQYPPAPAPVAKSNFLQSTGGKLAVAGAVILLLLLTLVILNYFTATIPLLPHKQSPQPQKITVKQAITEQQAETELEKIISSSIKSQYVPKEIKAYNISSQDEAGNSPEATFVTSWDASDMVNFQVFARFKNGELSPSDRQIFIGIPEKAIETTINSSVASSLADKYLSFKLEANFNCSAVNDKTPKLVLCQAQSNNSEAKNFIIQIEHPFKKPT